MTRSRIRLVVLLGILAGVGLFAVQRGNDAPQTPRPCGWCHLPEQVARVKSQLPCPDFCETEAYRDRWLWPEEVFLWEACRKVLGRLLPARDQGSIGSCVAFASASAIEHLLCIQMASGSQEDFQDIAQEVIYGGSRVEIGGGRIRGDGSTGAWAAKFVHDYGVVARGRHGRFDLRSYDVNRCREYGRLGVPEELENLARKHPIRAIANVRSWSECQASIRNGYPVMVCSDQGFSLRRDADGFARPQGVWMHAMTILGVKGGSRPGGFLLNSWGANAHSGPTGPGDPSPAGFWVDAEVLNRMLKQGDSWAFSQFVGFPSRRLDWYARLLSWKGKATCEPF